MSIELTHEQEKEMIAKFSECRDYKEIAHLINKYNDKYDLLNVVSVLGYCVVFNGKMADLYQKHIAIAEGVLSSK